MYPIVRYTVIYKDSSDYMAVKHLENDEALAEFISEVVEEREMDPEDSYFHDELSELVMIFEGHHKPKAMTIERISKLKVNLEP